MSLIPKGSPIKRLSESSLIFIFMVEKFTEISFLCSSLLHDTSGGTCVVALGWGGTSRFCPQYVGNDFFATTTLDRGDTPWFGERFELADATTAI
jgi:hypothetical protein